MAQVSWSQSRTPPATLRVSAMPSPPTPAKKPPCVQTHSSHSPVPSSHPLLGASPLQHILVRGGKAEGAGHTEAGEKKGTESITKRQRVAGGQSQAGTEAQRSGGPVRAPSLRETEADGARGPARGVAEQGHREPDTSWCRVRKSPITVKTAPVLPESTILSVPLGWQLRHRLLQDPSRCSRTPSPATALSPSFQSRSLSPPEASRRI